MLRGVMVIGYDVILAAAQQDAGLIGERAKKRVSVESVVHDDTIAQAINVDVPVISYEPIVRDTPE